MLNEKRLKIAMLEMDIKAKEVADMLGIDRVTFYRKAKGQSEFTLTEIRKICDMLHIDDPRPIFFDGQVS